MYICLCNAITDAEIREAVQEEGITTFNELKQCLGVSMGCGKCAPYAQDILEETLLQQPVRTCFGACPEHLYSY